MTSLHRALAGIGALAVVVGAAVVALIISGYYELRWLSVVFAVLGGFGFVGAGLYAWSRRPDRKVGALMTLTGFAWFAAMCVPSDNSVVFSLAILTSNVFAAVLMHLLLAYPDGELHTRGDRITVWLAYLLVTVGAGVLYLLQDPVDRMPGVPAVRARRGRGRCRPVGVLPRVERDRRGDPDARVRQGGVALAGGQPAAPARPRAGLRGRNADAAAVGVLALGPAAEPAGRVRRGRVLRRRRRASCCCRTCSSAGCCAAACSRRARSAG